MALLVASWRTGARGALSNKRRTGTGRTGRTGTWGARGARGRGAHVATKRILRGKRKYPKGARKPRPPAFGRKKTSRPFVFFCHSSTARSVSALGLSRPANQREICTAWDAGMVPSSLARKRASSARFPGPSSFLWSRLNHASRRGVLRFICIGRGRRESTRASHPSGSRTSNSARQSAVRWR